MKGNNHFIRYEAIDGLRTYAAIGIILMHVLSNGRYELEGIIYSKIIPSFTNLVFLFMTISAYSMCCGYYEKFNNNTISLNDFYTKRYKKIWPYFAFLCILDLIVAPSKDALYEVFANLTLCFGLLPNIDISVIGVGWFLGIVFVFYMVFPFFCYLISNKKRAWFVLLISYIFNHISSIYFGANRRNFVFCAIFFIAGGVIYLYKDVLYEYAKKNSFLILIICVILAVIYYIYSPSITVMLFLFSFLLIYSIGIDKKGILINSLTKYLSGISMEIYLSHMLIYRVLEKAGVLYIFGTGVVSYVLTSILTLVGTVLFAGVVNYIFARCRNHIGDRML